MTTASKETLHLPATLRRVLMKRARAADADPAEYTRAAIERGLALRDTAAELRAVIADAVTPLRTEIDTLRDVIRDLIGGAPAPARTQQKDDAARRQREDQEWDRFQQALNRPRKSKKEGKEGATK